MNARRPARYVHRAAVIVALASLLGSSACRSADQATTPPPGTGPSGTRGALATDEGPPAATKGRLVVGVLAESGGWSPAFSNWGDAGNIVASSVFEPLFAYDRDTNLVPWLAESATPNGDFTEWTVKLRPGITFHDGEPMNAQALVTSMTAATTEGLSSFAVKGMFKEIVRIDDLSFKIVTTQPWATFGASLTTQTGVAASPAMFRAADKGVSKPIGTGAYVFDRWEPDKTFQVHANDRYWGGPCALPDPGDAVRKLCREAGIPMGQRNGPWFDSMEFRPLPDEQQRVSALRSGDIQLLFTSSAKNIADAGTGFTRVTDFNSEKTFVQLNTSAPPLDNQHLRKALALATDRAAIAELISPDEELPADTSPFSQTSKWGLPPDQTGYPELDEAAARAEVDAYKKETGQSTVSFAIKGVASGDDLRVLQQLQQRWQSIGVEARIETLDQASLITTLISSNFQAILIRNYAYPDPDSQFFFFAEATTKGPLFINFSRYTTPTIEAALQQGRRTQDVAVRKPLYDSVVRERNAAVTEIWLYDTPYAALADKQLRGLNPFRGLAWGNFIPKPFLTGVWRSA